VLGRSATAKKKMCAVLLPPGVNPFAVNEYIISRFWVGSSGKNVGSCKYGNEQTDFIERGLLDNRGSRTWLPRLWLFRISSLGDPRTQTVSNNTHVFCRNEKKLQNSRKIGNTPNINNTEVVQLNYTHVSIQRLHASRAIRKIVLQLLKKNKYFREFDRKNSDWSHECKSSTLLL
jgi:hypothetical protein